MNDLLYVRAWYEKKWEESTLRKKNGNGALGFNQR